MTERDGNLESSVSGIFVAGDGGGIGGARVALNQGRIAGWAAARRATGAPLDGEPDTVRQARRHLVRDQAFQAALWTLFRAPQPDSGSLPDSTEICRCESVEIGTIRRMIADGVNDLGILKKRTRLGMGRCQGRYCAPVASRMLALATGSRPDARTFFAPQIPVKPIPAASLAVEKPEWGGHREVAPPPLAGTSDTGDARPDRQIEDVDVAVIGGGALGSCTAYFAAREGLEVALIERAEPNGEASGGNAGSLHVQLLSFDFGAKAQADGGAPALRTLPLQRESVHVWRALEEELGADFEIKITGGLMLAEDDRQMGFLKDKITAEHEQGIEVELLDSAALRSMAPAVDERMAGAAYCPLEGKINPLVATPAILEGARQAGTRIHPRTQVVSISRDFDGCFEIATNRGRVRARRVVNAAGAWSSVIGRMAGLNVPVKGAPLQMIVTEPAPHAVEQLLAHADRHLTMKQATAGNLIVGGGWTASLDEAAGRSRVLRESVEGNLWVARRVVPLLDRLHIIRTWAAMNVSIDGAPILGEAPGLPGFFNAVTSNGYTLAPIAGRITASLLAGRDPGHEIAPFSLGRFS